MVLVCCYILGGIPSNVMSGVVTRVLAPVEVDEYSWCLNIDRLLYTCGKSKVKWALK